jgi:hypothetical protein
MSGSKCFCADEYLPRTGGYETEGLTNVIKNLVSTIGVRGVIRTEHLLNTNPGLHGHSNLHCCSLGNVPSMGNVKKPLKRVNYSLELGRFPVYMDNTTLR